MKHSNPKIEDDVVPSKKNLGNETLTASDQTRQDAAAIRESSELLPCPFCGNRFPELVETHRDHWRVGCAKCGSYNNNSLGKDSAVKQWNCRSATGLEPEPSNEVCAPALTPNEEVYSKGFIALQDCFLIQGAKLNAAEQRIRALEEALRLIAEGARSEEPAGDSYDVTNSGDMIDYGYATAHFHLAQIARAALAPQDAQRRTASGLKPNTRIESDGNALIPNPLGAQGSERGDL